MQQTFVLYAQTHILNDRIKELHGLEYYFNNSMCIHNVSLYAALYVWWWWVPNTHNNNSLHNMTINTHIWAHFSQVDTKCPPLTYAWKVSYARVESEIYGCVSQSQESRHTTIYCMLCVYLYYLYYRSMCIFGSVVYPVPINNIIMYVTVCDLQPHSY